MLRAHAEKDLYATLGVFRTESLRGIRKAFRRLAKQYHPDHAGQHGTPVFQEILRAYEVLSDPEKRKRYNESLARRRSSRPLRSFSAESFFGPGWRGPSFDCLDFAVSLSPVEAAHGAVVHLRLPVQYLCPACSGTGEQWPYPCGFCGQTGVIQHVRELPVQLPPGLAYRSVIEIPPQRLGTRHRVRLVVTVNAPY